MKTGRGIGIGLLLAALCAVTAEAYSRAGFLGTVMDGTPDYSDEAFKPMEQLVPRLMADNPNDAETMDLFGKAIVRLMQPHGPIAGLRVVLRSGGENPDQRETTTATNGTFRFEDLSAGEYTLTIQNPVKGRHSPQEITWRLKVENDYSGLRDELVVPSEFVAVEGKVADIAGKPLAGIQITAEEYTYNWESGHWGPAAHMVKTTTDKQGRFKLAGLHPARFFPTAGRQGQYLLRAEDEGFAPRMQLITVETRETRAARLRWWNMFREVVAKEHQVEDVEKNWPAPADARGVLAGLDFTMTAASAVGGCVRDAAGNPLQAQVSLGPGDDVPKAISPLPGYSRWASSDDSGRFLFGDLVPGHYQVVARAAGYVERTVPCEVAEGQTRELAVEMTRAGTAIVDVTRNGRRETPKFIQAISAGGDIHFYWIGASNELGGCVFGGLPPGENRLRAGFTTYGKGEYGRYEETQLVVESDRTNHVALAVDGACGFDLDLAFPKDGTMRVWLNPADAPIVNDYWKDEQLKAFLWAEMPGRFAFDDLPAGDYRLSAQHFESRKNAKGQAWIPSQTQTIRLEEGQRPTVAIEF